MAEKPLERLNYFNGQRLEASDLKLEQEYHIRVRRWLNKSLYSAGIARGLEVKARTDTPAVVVSPGLALDSAGREIILLEEVEVPAVGNPSPVDGVVEGNYLTIQYREQTIEEELDGCAVGPSGHRAGNRLAWGGPARMLAQPVLALSDVLPAEDSGKVVLAQIELDANCQSVRRVHTNVREYVGGASDANVRQFALEGEKDIDANNPKKLYFHVRGRQPKAVFLYLRAEKFSTLYYTELGRHNHVIDLSVDSVTFPAHSHHIQGVGHTGKDGLHGHATAVTGDTTITIGPQQNGIAVIPFLKPINLVPPLESFSDDNLTARVNMQVGITVDGLHTHTIPGETDKYPVDGKDLTFPLSGTSELFPAEVRFPAAHGGAPLTYVSDLQILVDNVPCTTSVLSQVVNSRPPNEDWQGSIGDGKPHLGDGSASHPFAVNGTGPIKLDFLPPGVYFDEGEHVIEMKVASGGGRIRYNLYVE